MKLLFSVLFVIVMFTIVKGQKNEAKCELNIHIQNVPYRTITYELIPIGTVWARTDCNELIYSIPSSFSSSLYGGEQGYVDCRYNGFDYRAYSEGNETHFPPCTQSTAGLKPLRNGFYRINFKEDGLLKTFAYFDYRNNGFPVNPSCGCTGNNDMTIRYDANTEKILFWNEPSIDHTRDDPDKVMITGEILTWADWNCSRQTSNLENFWSNALVLATDASNHPRIVWGPYQENSMFVQYYNIYKKKGTNNFSLLTTATGYEFTDVNEVIPTEPSTQVPVYYYIKAFGQLAESNYESEPTNTVGINVRGGFDKLLQNSIDNLPNDYILLQNYPNPFNPSTKISYSIKEEGLVTLKVYDVLGKEIATLVNENKATGTYEAEFNASQLPSGMYIYKIQSGQFSDVKKMILTK